MLISGVAKDTDVARISVTGIPNEPGLAFKIFSKLSAAIDCHIASYSTTASNSTYRHKFCPPCFSVL